MSPTSFSKLICFESGDKKAIYFADLGTDGSDIPTTGTAIDAYTTFDNLIQGQDKITVTLGKVRTWQRSG
jgi:hypothetical protein